jgi:hypothetical protein
MSKILPTHLTRLMSPADQRAVSPTGRTPAETRAAAVVKDERELQRQVANYLRLLGVWHVQSRMDRRTSNTLGTPDFLLCRHGKFIAWECKCPWNRALRPEQAKAREAILAAGGEWRLVTTLAEAQGHLRELDGIVPREGLK